MTKFGFTLVLAIMSFITTQTLAGSARAKSLLGSDAALELTRQLVDITNIDGLSPPPSITPLNISMKTFLASIIRHRIVNGDEFGHSYPNAGFELSIRQVKCDNSMLQFVPARQKYDLRGDYASAFANDPAYRLAATAVDENCFSPLNTYSELHAWIGTAVGFLSLDEHPFCMAFRIEPTRLATARHCFYEKTNGRAALDSVRHFDQVRFHPLSNPGTSFQVKELLQVGHVTDEPIPHSQDLIHIALTSELPDPQTVISFRAPKVGEKIMVVGINSYIAANPPTALLRVSMIDSCYVGDLIDGCIFHGCSTAPGFSGSPLISRDSGSAPTIVGLHIAAAVHSGDCQASKGVGNIGAAFH